MRLLLLAPLLLAACAQEPQRELSPEERAVVLQMLMNRQPVQMPQIQMPPKPVTCTTIPIGAGQVRTVCQ